MKASDEKLNQLLNRSVPVPPSNNLSQRIIANARIDSLALSEESVRAEEYLVAKENSVNKESLFKQIISSLIIPKPAYALACSMILGVLLGWQNSDMASIDSTLDNDMQATTIEEDLSSLFLAEVNYYE